MRVIERVDEPALADRLHVRETPTIVHVASGRVAAAAVGPTACLQLLGTLVGSEHSEDPGTAP